MFVLKYFVTFLILCTVHRTLSKPVEYYYYSEGRGIGSTIWGWLSYPFTWWSSNDDILPESDQLVRSTHKPFETIEIGKHNVTIWCNDQTCTTMKCDKFGCVNISCNIYDTDLNGECREYNTIMKPEDPTSHKPLETVAQPVGDKEIRTTIKPSESTIAAPLSATETIPIQVVDERPLELEAVLSSTVTEAADTTEPRQITETSTFWPLGIDQILISYVRSKLINQATVLANSFILKLDIDSFCTEGVCYYSICEHENCKIKYCKYNLFTSERKCSHKGPVGLLKPNLNEYSIIRSNERINNYNTDKNVKLINRIINK